MIAQFIATLTGLVAPVQEMMVQGFIIFLRVGAAMAMLPAFGEQSVPLRVRLALGLAFTAVVLPAVGPFAWNTVFFLTEVVIGLALGFALRLFVMVLQMAGTMAAQATSLAQFFGGAGAEPQPAIAHLLVMGGLALAVTLGLHVRLAGLLILSYDLLPAGLLPGRGDLAAWTVANVGRAFALAFVLAAPFTLAALLYNVALGIINRAMPQLMVVFVGAPALVLGGLLLLMLAAPLMLAVWHDAFLRTLADPFRATP